MAEEPETVTRRRHSPSPELNRSQNAQPPRPPHPAYDRLTIFKLLVSVSLIVGIIVADGLNGSENVTDAEKNDRGTNSLSFTGRLRPGYAQFFLLLSPSSVRIQVTPHGIDVDLYVAANNDILYFEDRIPQLTKLMASVSNSQPTPMVKLDPPLSWETISPPEDVNSSTIYWSTEPPFSLSSIGLGVESIHIPAPSADDFHRPVLVLVFAPSGSFVASDDQASEQHQYTIEVVEEDGHYSTYESVRAAAEKGTLSYQNLADIFSTIHEEQSIAPSQGKVRGFKTPPPPRKPAQVVEEQHEESGPEHPLRPFIFGFLETLLNVIV